MPRHHVPLERFEFCAAPRRVVAIVDPAAGRGVGRRVLQLLTGRQWPAAVRVFTPNPANFSTYVEAIEEAHSSQAERIIVSGGDGTLMRVLTALRQTGAPLPLSVIPTGTGNVVAGDLHIPRRILPALRLAFGEATLHWWDIGYLRDVGYYFALRASAGHDANTLEYVSKQAKMWWRSMAYVGPAIREFMRMKPIAFRLTIDGGPPIELQGATAFVAVTSRLAGSLGFVLSNQIRTDDGILHAGVFHPQRLLRNIPRLVHHMAFEAENFANMVSLFPVRHEGCIEADPVQRTQIDGELLGSTPLVAQVVPHGVPFVTTPRHMYLTARFGNRYTDL
jgi:diacylglycerol kinase (ATP)